MKCNINKRAAKCQHHGCYVYINDETSAPFKQRFGWVSLLGQLIPA